MTRRRIFISHSNHDPEATALLAALKEHLTEAGFDPINFDEQVRYGKNWRHELLVELDSCDGAVIIVSRKALEPRSWVYRETSVLDFRNETRPEFVLIPVLAGIQLADLTGSALDEDFELSRLQIPPHSAADPAKVVVTQLLSDIPPERPLHELEAQVEVELEAVSDKLLGIMAGVLGVDVRGRTKEQKVSAVAQRLFTIDPTAYAGALEVISSQSNACNASRIVEISFPFCWIDPAAVEPLRARPAAVHSLALNSCDRLTARMYVQRAATGPTTYVFDSVPKSSENAHATTMEDALRTVAYAFGYPPNKSPQPSKLRDLIADRTARGIPVALLLDPPVDPVTIAELSTTYPDLIPLAMVDHPVPGGLPTEILVLHPHLDPDVENDSLATYRLIMRNAGYDILTDGTRKKCST